MSIAVTRLWSRTLFAVLATLSPSPALGQVDVSFVPLWDGETEDLTGPILNRFGGNQVNGFHATVSHTTAVVRSGLGAFRIDTNQVIPEGDFDFAGIALAGFFFPSTAYIDTRDLSLFQELSFWVRNDTGAPFTLVFEIKDYRDSNAHRARREHVLSAAPVWTQLQVPLDLGQPGWLIDGTPDLTRARVLTFVIEADQGEDVAGSVYVDDMRLTEPGGPLLSNAPLDAIVERLARRQFLGLWGTRDRTTGMMPVISSYANVCALNVLAAVIKMLPVAVERSWVSAAEADAFVAQAVATLDGVMDGTVHVPPRYLDRVTLTPEFGDEESSVDAAMLFLALYQYKSIPATPSSLQTAIESLLDRFDLAAFSSPAGWRLAYYLDTDQFTTQTYDGYSGEPWLISLAVHLSSTHYVDIETHYHSAVLRARAFLVDPARSHLVHTLPEFRAPFLQWLFPLFVSLEAWEEDSYSDRRLASNPRVNAILYQQEAHARAAALGRPTRLQPDAGDDGSGSNYQQFSFYQDFGQPDLYMPWSAAFGLLADPATAGAALRDHLENGLHGPLGLSDAVHWTTGEPRPDLITARHDFWNVSLSTMALLQYLYGGNDLLGSLPEVEAALARVFPADGGALFYAVTPCRLADTRGPAGPYGSPALVSGVDRAFTVSGACGIPPWADAVSVNATVVNPSAMGHLTFYPESQPPPLASTLNFNPGQVRANNAILRLGNGKLVVRPVVASGGSVDLIVDVNGYFD